MNNLGKTKFVIIRNLMAIFIMFLVPLAFADTPESDMSSYTGIIVPVFPSKSSASKTYEKALYQSRDKWIKAGHEDDIHQCLLAFTNRDMAWSTAQTILEGIISGHLNTQNISDYATPYFNSLLISNPQALQFIFNKIRSYGDKAVLSTRYTETAPSDYMIMEKDFGQDKIKIVAISFIAPVPYAQIKQGHQVTYIKVVLSADKPYKKWLLAGIFINYSKTDGISGN